MTSIPATPDLEAAIEAVARAHQQGDWTEPGWVGSPDGIECSGCREDWPCSATRLRLAALRLSVRDSVGDTSAFADEVRAGILRNLHEPWVTQNEPLAAAWNRGLHQAHEIVDELAAALNRRQDDPR